MYSHLWRRASIILLLASLSLGLAVARSAEPETVTPESLLNAKLMYVSAKWKVWRTSTKAGDERLRAILYRMKYYRQRVGETGAVLIYQWVGAHSSKDVLTVLNDGTVILNYRDDFAFVKNWGDYPKNRPDPGDYREDFLTINGQKCNGLYADEECIILQPHVLNSRQPVYYVPIRKGEGGKAAILLIQRVEVTDENKAEVNSPPHFGRYRHLLTWIEAGNFRNDGGDCDRLTVLNMQSKERWSVNLPTYQQEIQAFDGSRVRLHGSWYNARTSARLGDSGGNRTGH